LLQDWLANVNYTTRYDHSENHRFIVGVSAAFGENNFERNTQVYALQLEYQWSEDGPGEEGRWFVWRTEFALRHFGARSIAVLHAHGEDEPADDHVALHEGEHETEHKTESSHPQRRDFTDVGLYTTAMCGWSQRAALQARAEWVSGTDEAGLDERWRLSPGIAWRPTEHLDLLVRTQYNFDHSPGFGSEHSIWTQFVIGWGGGHHHDY
jgi:hypothetical protein